MQEYKTVYIDNNGEPAKVFHSAHSFRSAHTNAMIYIKMNQAQHTISLYKINRSSHGERYILIKTYEKGEFKTQEN